MKILNEFRNLVKKIGKLEKAYFTTYNISLSFVEKYILTSLFDLDPCKDEYDYYDLDLKLMNEKIDIKFFYDLNMYDFSLDEKRTMLEIYPIKQEHGVFHPKVIYLEGEITSYLIVGSGNLTKSGWSENIECFQLVEIYKDSNLAKQTNQFFNEVFKLSGINKRESRKITPQKAFPENTFNDEVNFIFSCKYNKEDSILINSLELDFSDSIFVWSPYFSKDIIELSEKEFENKILHIIPDFISEDRIRVDEEKILDNFSKQENILIYKDLEKPEKQKVNHSKLWIANNKIVIGSYNFTRQALYGNNFEAALVLKIEMDNILTSRYEKIDPAKLQTSIEKSEDDKEINSSYTSLFQLIVNWKNRTIILKRIVLSKKIETITLSLHNKTYIFNSIENEYYINTNFSKSELQSLFNIFLIDKEFSIYDSEDLLFKGLILEEGANQSNREILHIETLAEMLNFNPESFKKNITREEYEKIFKYRNEKINNKNVANNIDYFNIYKFFLEKNRELHEILNKGLEKDKELEKFCYSGAKSLFNIKSILEKEKENVLSNDLRLYLMIDEYIQIVNKIKNCEDLIMNQNLTLTKEDENFIKRFIYA